MIIRSYVIFILLFSFFLTTFTHADAIFTACNETLCMEQTNLFQLKQVETNLPQSALGIWIDFRDSRVWKVQIQSDNIALPFFVIGNHEFECTNQTKHGIGVSLVEKRQNGKMHQLTCELILLEPDIHGDFSIFDHLRLYHDYAEFLVETKSDNESPPKQSFKGRGNFRKLSSCPKEATNKKNIANSFEALRCSDGKACFECRKYELSIMMNEQIIDADYVNCGQKGWFSNRHKKIAKYEGQAFYCLHRCDQFFLETKSVFDENNKKAEPVFDNNTNSTTCKHVPNSSLLFGGVPMNDATCDEGKYYDGNKLIQEVKFERIPVQCFGAFLFIRDNCDTTEEQIELGCSEPLYKEGVITCRVGYSLLLNQRNYPKLSIIGDGWYGASAEKPVGKVELDKKPICVSKCSAQFIIHTCEIEDETCSTAVYENKELSCSDPNEILIVEHEGIQRESFEPLICSVSEWTYVNGTHCFDLSTTQNFNIKARCEKVCHPKIALKPIPNTCDSDSKNVECMRKYELEKPLTCAVLYKPGSEAIDKDTKLILPGVADDIYADLTCNKSGWWSIDGKAVASFHENHRTQLDFKCVESDCMTDKYDACDEMELCQRPQQLKKHHLTCPEPTKLIQHGSISSGNPLFFGELTCKNGAWLNERKEIILKKGDKFDLTCFVADCARCGRGRVSIQECSKDDSNCAQPSFHQGSFIYCSHYTCPAGFAYRVSSGRIQSFYPNPPENPVKITLGLDWQAKIKDLNTECEYLTPDKSVTVINLGCVKQIPCTFHTSLNDSCSSLNVECEGVTKLLEANELVRKPTTCSQGFSMYLNEGTNVWSQVDNIRCRTDGLWDANLREKTVKLEKGRQVICAKTNPTITTTPPPTTLPTTPKPNAARPCAYCPQLPNVVCDGCSADCGLITKREEDAKCIATSSTGRISYNDAEETTAALQCKMEEKEMFEWMTEDGKIVAKFSAREARFFDKLNALYAVTIIIVPIVILAIVAGLLIYLRKRKIKAEAAKKQRSDKMSEQKNDAIIDSVDVPIPDSLVL